STPTALAPGQLIAISGQNLTRTPQTIATTPLPGSAGDLTVVAGGEQVPLLSTSAQQILAILPLDLTVNSANDLVVSRGTSLSGIVPLNIIPAQPFITTIQPVAKAGDTIVIEAVGLGTASTG